MKWKDIFFESGKKFSLGWLSWTYIFLLVSFIVISIPFLVDESDYWYSHLCDLNELGDAFNGITAPIIALIAAMLTFLAFWVQYKANQSQRKAFQRQRKDIQIERFENKFYNLIEIHRNNINEISIGKAQKEGRHFYLCLMS